MLLYDEIVQVTKWRMLRGKFRPSILDLVKTNTETAVKNVTKKAFKKMPNINAAITALTQLKGVSSATASGMFRFEFGFKFWFEFRLESDHNSINF